MAWHGIASGSGNGSVKQHYETLLKQAAQMIMEKLKSGHEKET